MKTKQRHITKIIAFLLVVALLFGGAVQVLRISDDTHSRAEFDTFYRLDKNSLDAVWIAFPLAECVALASTILFWRKVYRNEIQPLYNAER